MSYTKNTKDSVSAAAWPSMKSTLITENISRRVEQAASIMPAIFVDDATTRLIIPAPKSGSTELWHTGPPDTQMWGSPNWIIPTYTGPEEYVDNGFRPPTPGVGLTKQTLLEAWDLLQERGPRQTAEQWLKDTPIPIAPMKSSAKIVADLMRREAAKLCPEHNTSITYSLETQ